MILESIVTTANADGQVNIAPMGPSVDAGQTQFVLRPFTSSRTYSNLSATGKAVIHVTDDAMLFARGAVDQVQDVQSLVEQDKNGFWILKDCHRWFAVEVEIDPDSEAQRIDLPCTIIDSGVVRPFFGFNRAKHAVLEAAILATRTHILEPEKIHREMEILRPLIDKTAGKDEHDAFALLTRTINERLASR